jgi:plasmid replication initiation protein
MSESTELAQYDVTMSNALTRASHSLSLVEKRLVAAAIAKTDSRKGTKMHAHLAQFTNLKITAIEFAETYGVDTRNAYEELKSASKNLFHRYIKISHRDGDEDLFRWVSGVKYRKSQGYVELSFTAEVYPHLNAIRGKYTSYKLKNAASLRSVYSWRLFELAKSWLNWCKEGKQLKIQLKDLMHALETPSSYKWDNLRTRALDPAIKEIEQHAGLKISYSVIKTGRSITALDISVCEISQMQLPLT